MCCPLSSGELSVSCSSSGGSGGSGGAAVASACAPDVSAPCSDDAEMKEVVLPAQYHWFSAITIPSDVHDNSFTLLHSTNVGMYSCNEGPGADPENFQGRGYSLFKVGGSLYGGTLPKPKFLP